MGVVGPGVLRLRLLLGVLGAQLVKGRVRSRARRGVMVRVGTRAELVTVRADASSAVVTSLVHTLGSLLKLLVRLLRKLLLGLRHGGGSRRGGRHGECRGCGGCGGYGGQV
ncbi:uncharacterized protein GGS22DRAFT_158011 [Annulohypoxylon maeteangense]|uniref:uncharacterized protein n=1 Tax=Annulohypoxylon maeteangense TaxID=1927788 RepID=UPI002007B034|nr:uncharacterized protein GGS22DRAFT_158011 [Annulohypoxylon maeteangense]KAI0886504.1 hypothetical protein GGS22DRAFT_158011 [Annulohypoxylon maeteangense]